MQVSFWLIQFLFPLLGLAVFIVCIYFGIKFGYNTWDKMKRDAALRAKVAAEARRAEEAAENEQLRDMWAEGAQQTGTPTLSDDIDDTK